jgi:hypothetical protein
MGIEAGAARLDDKMQLSLGWPSVAARQPEASPCPLSSLDCSSQASSFCITKNFDGTTFFC